MEKIKMRFTGVAPMLMHNGHLVDPMNEWTRERKKVTGKKGQKKTDADLIKLRWLEWRGSLYLNDKNRPCVPGDVIHAVLVAGARKARKGQDVDAAILVEAPDFPLKYDGPTDIEKLYEDPRFVDVRGACVNAGRVMRSRPVFPKWSVDIEVSFDPTLVNREDVVQAARANGEQIGIGDYTPRFGRFLVQEI